MKLSEFAEKLGIIINGEKEDLEREVSEAKVTVVLKAESGQIDAHSWEYKSKEAENKIINGVESAIETVGRSCKSFN